MADEYYPFAMDFILPNSVPGFQEYQTHASCHSIALQNEIQTYSYVIPYSRVEEFIATVTGGERKKPRPGVPKAPGQSKIRRRVTG